MNLLDFDREIQRSPLLEVVGVDPEETVIAVRVQHYKPGGYEARIVDITINALERMPVRLLEGWLLGRPILTHMTRIVGYFSPVNKSWNRSKLAELKDRQAGDYTFNGH